ncbi:glycosyltransferase family 61 protein [Granulosicoccus sp.]|nr:glycosyltransferase family 61 protein [Granulosicoccus sp.]MDB4224440.1 glycosyltransferase family 61 protein [Granulosicoccus sp.]
MVDILFSFLISRTKWRKLGLLLKELVLTVRFRVAKLVGIGSVGVESVAELNEENSFVEVVTGVTGTALSETSTKSTNWKYQANAPVGIEVFSRSAINYLQDSYIDSREVQTDHNYQLTEVVNASVCTNGVTHVSIYGADDSCLPEYSYVKYGRNRARVKNKKRHIAIHRIIRGITLNLYGNVENTAGNYGHWMVDGVGLLYLALREYSIGDIDYFLVPILRYDFQKESLLAVGIPEHKIIELPALSCYRFERLICASAPRGFSSGVTPGWLIDGYRRELLPMQTISTGRRLYISRRDANSRKFVNEDDVVHLLENVGFDIIELSQYNFVQKIALFANAEIIVGLSGAGLTNLMFCARGTRVIEIFPTNFVTYFYASMAGYLELDYRALIIENHSVLSTLNKYYGNLVLDLELLRETLRDVV